ncbi:MAG: hypothetical protein AAFY81_02230 [Pseudomonadota bacterium]
MTGPLPLSARLIDDARALADDRSQAARFVAGFLEAEPGSLITNAHSRMTLMSYGSLRLPVTIEDGRLGGTYVASPHSAYVLYARDEIDIVGLKGAARLGAGAALGLVDRWLKALAINRTVHIDNWLLSTSLHGRWDGTGLPTIRRALIEAYPDHVPVVRCVDRWSGPELYSGLRSDGWSLLPSRQVWVTEDLEAQWKPRSHTKSDRRAMRKSGLVIEELEAMSDADAQRLADLYAQLYLQRYSALNPAYTPAFIKLSCKSGALRFRVARASDGVIMASAGMRVAGDTVTVPMLGYDTTRPQSEALYRIASLLSSEWAMERGYRHHGSSGASTFKTNRGARGQIEYMALYTGHLPWGRRMGIKSFAEVLERTMVPALQKQGW